MTSPAGIPTPVHPARPFNVVSMVNQVTFEGYLVRAWIHGPYRFLRLANQRPPEMGGSTDGRKLVESDYVTVRLDPSVPFEMNRAAPGLHLYVRGRIEGRDIPETIGEIVAHCGLALCLPLEIANLHVSRPAVQICCTTLEFRRSNPPRAVQSRPRIDPGTQPAHVDSQAGQLSRVDQKGSRAALAEPDPSELQPIENQVDKVKRSKSRKKSSPIHTRKKTPAGERKKI